jgi:hypothetical protein
MGYWDLINMRDDVNRYAASTDRGFEKPSGWNMIAHPITDGTAGILLDDAVGGITDFISRIFNDIFEKSPVLIIGGVVIVYAVLKR